MESEKHICVNIDLLSYLIKKTINELSDATFH